ncbi:RNA polymerase sigma factor [Sphingomonas xinjiangensis]|uniref:RNA polymerase sigma-70 factor (ECF subfamily) n=1 Tax=Sphingomonas xinjiangensis TaxID=643568 RepID=A0A840YS34_9SPHN|nr:sigma-70 family RNA polymerase sigma factor [Sphingomonas xinjiangensis]MBB5712491.1 RNA polymerase sigma-70 factor (ECF subfamily) [Sphingomonas xinjiangensis]
MIGRDEEAERARSLAKDSEKLRRSLTRYFERRVQDGSEAEDLVQEVFVRIVQRVSAAEIDHFSGYVFQTARSVLSDRQRRRAARHANEHVTFEPEVHRGEDLDAGRHAEAKAELRAATKALLDLPERTRTVFVLRRLEGLRHREIAERLGISVSAVEKHMLRAISYLAANFGGTR